MSEQSETLRPQELTQEIITAIEQVKKRLLRKIKRKRKKLVKFAESLGENFETISAKWSTSLITTTLTAGIFLTTVAPVTFASIPKVEIVKKALTPAEKEDLRQKMLEYLRSLESKKRANASFLANIVSQMTGLRVKSTLDGKKIPAVYGEIATEKHLQIYAGETISAHLANPENFAKYHWAGMSRTPSAWGYFAANKNEVTPDLIEKEKYYLVMQTFVAEDWNRDWPKLKEWYKFRKLVVFNPENGAAVIGVVADAGPALYTGRAFGGSPEVMEALGLSETQTQGDVLVFFLDDSENFIPLGPIQ